MMVKAMLNVLKAVLLHRASHRSMELTTLKFFSPVARFSSICILLAYAAKNKLLVHQIDVVSAFLNGELNEKSIYSNHLVM